MKKRFNFFKLACFLTTIALIICCFVGCGTRRTAVKDIMTTASTTSQPRTTTTPSSTIIKTTTVPTTVPPTTTKPTKVEPTTVKPTEAVEEETSFEEDAEAVGSSEEFTTSESNNNGDLSDNNNNTSRTDVIYSPSEFMNAGVINWGGWKWTYYSERILPGEGLWIPGRWTDSDGYVCDENGYVCLASTSAERYSVVETPFGRTGKVYDTGCDYGVMDVYVNW